MTTDRVAAAEDFQALIDSDCSDNNRAQGFAFVPRAGVALADRAILRKSR